MVSNHSAPRVQLRKTLTLFQVVMIGLAYIQPMTIFDTFGIVSEISGGHVPTAYIMALLAVLLTALSYGKLVRRYPSAGSAYTYAQQAINPYVGFMVGWSSLLAYLFMPMINILLARIYLVALFPAIPGWVFVVALTLIMTFVNLKGIHLVANLNSLIVIVQMTIIFIFVCLVIYGISQGKGAGTLVSSKPFLTIDSEIVPIIAGATILCFSFLGFDGISSLSEETKDAENVIPRAIFLTALIGGIIFIVVSYFVQLYFPDVSSFKHPDESLPEIALYVGGTLFQSILLCFTCITVLASGMAAQAGVSRLLYVMGRDRVFYERWFGYVHHRWQTPVINVIIVGILALSAEFFDLVTGTALINFGALVAFSFVNLSVIAQFYYREKRNKTVMDTIRYCVLPLMGALTVGILWINTDISSMILGGIWAGFGFFYMVLITGGLKTPPPHFADG